jgi:hypothetical protein
MNAKRLYLLAVTMALAAAPYVPNSRAAGFNGDGISDIVWRSQYYDVNAAWIMPQVRWFNKSNLVQQTSQTNFQQTGTSCCWNMAAVADFNRDGHPDFLWREYSTGQTAMWLMNGTNIQSASVRRENISDPGGEAHFDRQWVVHQFEPRDFRYDVKLGGIP